VLKKKKKRGKRGKKPGGEGWEGLCKGNLDLLNPRRERKNLQAPAWGGARVLEKSSSSTKKREGQGGGHIEIALFHLVRGGRAVRL